MHKPLFRIAVGSVAAVGGLIAASALPAGAATSVRAETMADPTVCTAPCAPVTPVTFTVGAIGVLTISVPTPLTAIPLGTVSTSGGTASASLGTVTVVDAENSDPANWSVSVSDSSFTDAASHTIADTAASYTTAPNGVTVILGVGGSITDNTGGSGGLGLSTDPAPAVAESGAVGANSAHWSPTVSVTVPDGSIAGTYTGTITHSIS